MEGRESTVTMQARTSDPVPVRATLLGRFSLSGRDGRDLTPRGRKACCILAYLLLDGRHSASRDKLIGMLWSDRGEEQARGSLRQALAEIRRYLGHAGSGVIEIQRYEVNLDRKSVACDLDQTGPFADWPGELLDGLDSIDPAFDDWLQMERARLRDRWLREREDHLTTTRESGSPERVLQAASLVLDFDPTHEAAARDAIRALASLGRRAEALRCYNRLVEALESILSVKPSEETLQLIETVRQEHPPASNGNSAAAPAAAATHSHIKRAEPPKIVVLPLVNLSSDAADDYLSDGLSDELITCLSRFAELQVLSRHASFGFRGPNIDLARLRDSLGARYALHGSFIRSLQRIRLNVHISDTANGHQVWGERLDLDFDDLLGIMDHVVERVRSSVLPAVEQKEVVRAQLTSTDDLRAYDLYLRGKYIYYAAQGANYAKEALDYFERAIALDPQFASAIIQLIRLYNTELFFSTAGGPLHQYRARALELAERLLQIDATNPNAHISMAWCQLWQKRFMLAEQHFEDALRLNPYEADRMNAIATGFMYLGRLDDALNLITKAKGIATFDLDFFRTDFAEIHYLKGDFTSAREYLEFAEGRSIRPLLWRCATYGQLGLIEEARREGEAFLAGIDRLWIGAPDSGPQSYLTWFFEFLPFARAEDEALLREGLKAGGLPA